MTPKSPKTTSKNLFHTKYCNNNMKMYKKEKDNLMESIKAIVSVRYYKCKCCEDESQKILDMRFQQDTLILSTYICIYRVISE